jgi:arylsulfatase A-like enzyme
MITPDESAQGGRKNSSGEPYGTYYWTGPGQLAVENLSGDDSRVIMDRAIPFIRQAAGRDNPFFAVIWFHTPHLPVLTGKKYRDMYPDRSSDEQHYYGCITAMDEQVGRLRKELAELGIEDHTLLWYCADNGPEGKEPQGRTQGRTKGLRGRKRDLYEGGIRVPGLLVWPDKIKKQRHITMPCSTSDYYPTVLDVLNIEMPNQPRPIDGTSLVPLLEGKMTKRPYPIAFETRHGDKKPLALVDNRYKLYSPDDGNTFELYDIINDPSETTDLADQNPEKVRQLKTILLQWRASCEQSLAGKDYF